METKRWREKPFMGFLSTGKRTALGKNGNQTTISGNESRNELGKREGVKNPLSFPLKPGLFLALIPYLLS
jgi:hypothetical protein